MGFMFFQYEFKKDQQARLDTSHSLDCLTGVWGSDNSEMVLSLMEIKVGLKSYI